MMDPDKYFGAEDAPISLRLGKEHPMGAGKKSKGLCQHLGRGVTVERLPQWVRPLPSEWFTTGNQTGPRRWWRPRI